MVHPSRRSFLRLAAASPLVSQASPAATEPNGPASVVSLNGPWQFRVDTRKDWTEVSVPHTWQVMPEWADYRGVAWYRRTFHVPAGWSGQTVRVEFEAVYHSAVVWVNGHKVGEHLCKGYTAFALDITNALRPGENSILVKADNRFDLNMLPRGGSFDWAMDGGIIRPVSLLVTPPVFIGRVDVDALPDLASGQATLDVRVVLRNAGQVAARVEPAYQVIDNETGEPVLSQRGGSLQLRPGATETATMPAATLAKPRLWHFDHPHLYRLVAEIPGHRFETTFGVRRIEVKDCALYLNGERVWLMGVERMAGSHPEYGMAEPEDWIVHDHKDLKELNCVFTRVHWQQDHRVLDYCDRHGILIQEEVPSWGPATFRNPTPEVAQNGLEQLREMIQRDRNHPCIFSWGLCNEVNGQNPASQDFIRRMYQEAKTLDPHRLRSYASNSLRKTIERDAAGLMDFVEWNEYYESWYKGTVDDMRRNLEAIHQAFPDKMIVISEYGFCECNPTHVGGDPRRIEILRQHTGVFREHDFVGGAIFFDYNDYRTHMGDKGIGVLKQRVHGVVDLYGARKPSFEALREESSPVELVAMQPGGSGWNVRIRTRNRLPAYRLTGYKLRWIVYGYGDLPMEQCETDLPDMAPGQEHVIPLSFQEKHPRRIQVDVLRPTGFSALHIASGTAIG